MDDLFSTAIGRAWWTTGIGQDQGHQLYDLGNSFLDKAGPIDCHIFKDKIIAESKKFGIRFDPMVRSWPFFRLENI